MTQRIADLDEYQRLAARTAGDGADSTRIAISALGIAGEAGEVADLVKKWLGHSHDLSAAAVAKELGDVLWYVSDLARLFGLTLSEVASMNIRKLEERYPTGFSSERSRNRSE